MTAELVVPTRRVASAPRVQLGRIVVIDVLRGIALLGMLVAHAHPLLPGGEEGPISFAMGQLNDIASPLFALTMGISAQLVASRTPRRSWGVLLVQQIARGFILIALGLWLASWGTWVDVVLAYLGVLLIVGAPLLFLPTIPLAIVAAAVALVSAPLNSWAADAVLRAGFDQPDAVRYLEAWVFVGYNYRLTNLLPFFLLGALLMRGGLARSRLLIWMAGIGVAAYAVRPLLAKFTDTALYASGSYPDTLHDVGLVFLVYALVIWLAGIRRSGPARVVAAVFQPLRALGSLALSLYVLHVAVLALWMNSGIGYGAGYRWFFILVGGTTAVAWVWWRFVGTGPIELLMGLVTGRYRWPWRRRVAASDSA
ncbi:heparan-alpha-glucosaminide N-acetyltransferase domain-containing protein [Microbacterium sp. P5_E9]